MARTITATGLAVVLPLRPGHTPGAGVGASAAAATPAASAASPPRRGDSKCIEERVDAAATEVPKGMWLGLAPRPALRPASRPAPCQKSAPAMSWRCRELTSRCRYEGDRVVAPTKNPREQDAMISFDTSSGAFTGNTAVCDHFQSGRSHGRSARPHTAITNHARVLSVCGSDQPPVR